MKVEVIQTWAAGGYREASFGGASEACSGNAGGRADVQLGDGRGGGARGGVGGGGKDEGGGCVGSGCDDTCGSCRASAIFSCTACGVPRAVAGYGFLHENRRRAVTSPYGLS